MNNLGSYGNPSDSRRRKINILFLRYKALRDEASRDALTIAVYDSYTCDYARAKMPDWPDAWRDEVMIKLAERFERVLDNPQLVKDTNGTCKLTAYITCGFYSLCKDVYNKRSREQEMGRECVSRVAEKRSPNDMKFAEMVWERANNLPGIRGEIFRLYLLGIESRSQHGGVNENYTLEGIARKLGLSPAGVSTHIRRAKIILERELRPLGLKMGVLSKQSCYR